MLFSSFRVVIVIIVFVVVAVIVVFLLTEDEMPFREILEDDDPMRACIADIFRSEDKVAIPVVDVDFVATDLEGITDDCRQLARTAGRTRRAAPATCLPWGRD